MKNHFTIEDETAKVYSNGRYTADFFFIDRTDLENISAYSWRIYTTKNGYKRVETSINTGNNKIKHILLSRYLLNPPSGIYVDHIDCNPTNNRRANLRLANRFENCQNAPKFIRGCSSIYKGVSWHTNKNKWIVSIMANNKSFHIGYFTDEILAAKAYDQKAKELFGEFANLNFPIVLP